MDDGRQLMDDRIEAINCKKGGEIMNKLTLVMSLLLSMEASSHALQSAMPYDRFGIFENLGGPHYAYRVIDAEGLKRLVLPGIYPNVERRAKGPKISPRGFSKNPRCG